MGLTQTGRRPQVSNANVLREAARPYLDSTTSTLRYRNGITVILPEQNSDNKRRIANYMVLANTGIGKTEIQGR
jgi:hypothetical protein